MLDDGNPDSGHTKVDEAGLSDRTRELSGSTDTLFKLFKIDYSWRNREMDNQHKMIKGYRDLSQGEINLMNEVKSLAEQVGNLIEKIQSAPPAVTSDMLDPDRRWLSLGKTDLQKGFMSVIRSIAKPESF